MIRSGWIMSLFLLSAVACAPVRPVASEDDAATTDPAIPPRSREVAKALLALEGPALPHVHINEPGYPTKAYLPDDYYDDCPDAIDLLTRTDDEVDGELLHLAKPGSGLHVRYRAARILAGRGNRAVIPVLEKMSAAKIPEERFLALHLYGNAVREKHLPAPKEVSQLLNIYASEKDREVKEVLEGFFGTARATSAVNALLATLRQGDGESEAIWALGEIRDPRAVPIIVANFPKSGNKHFHLQALGKLATPEAVDFLIQHLDVYCAPEALYETRSPRALPALRQHLKRLRRTHSDVESNIAATRIAIVRLSQQDPTLTLLGLAEDAREGEHVRHDAIAALDDYDSSKLHDRLLKLFKGDTDWYVRRQCAHLLTNSSLEGVTEALTRTFLTCGGSGDYRVQALESGLLDVLNKRLKTSFRKADDLRAFLEKQQGKQPR
jgi:HEAT repeat protein